VCNLTKVNIKVKLQCSRVYPEPLLSPTSIPKLFLIADQLYAFFMTVTGLLISCMFKATHTSSKASKGRVMRVAGAAGDAGKKEKKKKKW